MDSQGHTESGKSSTQQNRGFSDSTRASFPHMGDCLPFIPPLVLSLPGENSYLLIPSLKLFVP